MDCRVLARIYTHSVRLEARVEPFCASTVPIPREFRFPLLPPPVCDLSLTCIVHAAFISTAAFTWLVVLSNIVSISPLIKLMIGLTLSLIDASESRTIGTASTSEFRTESKSAHISRSSPASSLPTLATLPRSSIPPQNSPMSFSTMALLEVSEADCTAIDMAMYHNPDRWHIPLHQE